MTDRNSRVIRSLNPLFNRAFGWYRLLSILPVDQGIEHSAVASFANPIYFDPENIVKLAIDGGFSNLGVLGSVAGMLIKYIVFKI